MRLVRFHPPSEVRFLATAGRRYRFLALDSGTNVRIEAALLGERHPARRILRPFLSIHPAWLRELLARSISPGLLGLLRRINPGSYLIGVRIEQSAASSWRCHVSSNRVRCSAASPTYARNTVVWQALRSREGHALHDATVSVAEAISGPTSNAPDCSCGANSLPPRGCFTLSRDETVE